MKNTVHAALAAVIVSSGLFGQALSGTIVGAVTDSVHVVERRNLPDPVQPGSTYRDVFIAVEILGHLNAECLASKIGVSQAPASGDACASLSIRDSAQARPAVPRRPPQ